MHPKINYQFISVFWKSATMELQVKMLLLGFAAICEHEGYLIKMFEIYVLFHNYILRNKIKTKEKKNQTAGCFLSTSQWAMTSKCTLRLKISIHQLKNNHCTGILIANLLTSIKRLFIPHAEQKILISIPRVSFKVTSKIHLLEWSAVTKTILLV